VPKSLYGPAYVTAAPLVDPPNPEKAKEFIALLLSKEGQDMFRKYDLPAMDSKDAN
jgi:ABC-type Fe3+ transport system substrate-binding protein